jgi:hypothetical protein
MLKDGDFGIPCLSLRSIDCMWTVDGEPTNDLGIRHVDEVSNWGLKPCMLKAPKNGRHGGHQEALSLASTAQHSYPEWELACDPATKSLVFIQIGSNMYRNLHFLYM